MKVTKGNVFDHLGFPPEESLELKIKADILLAIREHIKKRGFTQKQIAEKLKVHQPDASKLMSGKISSVTIDQLLVFAGRLNLGATITITDPVKPRTKKAVKAESAASPSLAHR